MSGDNPLDVSPGQPGPHKPDKSVWLALLVMVMITVALAVTSITVAANGG